MKQTHSQAAIRGGSRKAAQRGASLIEVLVILVILLIGLGTIIRIFPIGLGTLRTTETRTLAVQLANQQAEQLKADAENLPQGVLLAYFDANGNRVFDATEDADSLTPYNPNPNKTAAFTPNPYYTDVNKYRFIDGEVVKVAPSVRTDDFGSASIYLAKFGPIFMSDAAGKSDVIDSKAINYLRVYSAPFQEIAAPYRSNGTAANPPDNSGQANNYLRGSQSYLLDPDDSEDDDGSGVAHILLPRTGTKKPYLISYSYDSGSGVYKTIDKVPFPDVTGTTGNQWEPIILNGTPIPVLPGSVRVFRLFERVTTTPGTAPTPGTINWVPEDPAAAVPTFEPYQYALLDDNIAPSANIGRIAFYPSGASYGQRNAGGQQAFTAYMDYAVLDWHILREDREVSSGLPGRNGVINVRTTLGNWKRAGDPNPDNTLYDGMFGANTTDVVIIDLQTGRRLVRGIYDPSALDLNADYWINEEDNGSFRSGIVYMNSGKVPGGSQIRILYKAQGDWAVSFQKAYSRYQAVDAVTGYPATDSPSSFTTGDGTANNTRAYFNRSEYNKSFLARFQYVYVNPLTGEEKITQTAPQQVTLDGADGEPFETVTVPQAVEFSFADCAEFMPNRKLNTRWSVVSNVAYGVSVKTRVIYRDSNSGRGVGDAEPSSGWRVQDVDTYLTRAF